MAAIPLSLTVDTAATRRSWRSSVLSIVSSILIQFAALVALALMPLLSMGALPDLEGRLPLPRYIPVVPIARRLGVRHEGNSPGSSHVNRTAFITRNVVPARFSDEIPIETEWFGDPQPGVPDGVLVGLIDYIDPGPAPIQDVPVPEGPVVVGVDVTPPRKLHHVSPVYPPIAASARIEGTIVLEAIIDRDGNVSNLRVLKSIRLLDNAAVDAVRQWKYEPTRLNGRPVPVVMTVTVSFVLKR